MKRSTLNFMIDMVLLVLLIGLAATGLLLHFRLPPGSGSFRVIWSMSRHEWGDKHFWLGLSFACISAVHVILHWTWLKNVAVDAYHASKSRALVGAVILVASILVAGSILLSAAETRERGAADAAGHRRRF